MYRMESHLHTVMQPQYFQAATIWSMEQCKFFFPPFVFILFSAYLGKQVFLQLSSYFNDFELGQLEAPSIS